MRKKKYFLQTLIAQLCRLGDCLLLSDYGVVAEYFRAARKFILVCTTHFILECCCKKVGRVIGERQE